MKKIIATWLLATFLFNLGGYYIFFYALKIKANHELSAKLDNGNYDERATIEIKVPISLPYPLQTGEFERKAGRFVYNQEHYQLVKQKYANDTLTIVAIKDAQTNQIANVMDSFSEASGDQNQKEGSLNIPVKIQTDYLSVLVMELMNGHSWSRNLELNIYIEQSFLADLSSESPPPRLS